MAVYWPSGDHGRMESALQPLIEAFEQGHRNDMMILELIDKAADSIVALEARIAGLEAREQARQDKQLLGDAA